MCVAQSESRPYGRSTQQYAHVVSLLLPKGKNQLEGPTRELRSLVKELRGVISGNHRPHTANTAAGRCICRRTSTPEREDTTAQYVPHLSCRFLGLGLVSD